MHLLLHEIGLSSPVVPAEQMRQSLLPSDTEIEVVIAIVRYRQFLLVRVLDVCYLQEANFLDVSEKKPNRPKGIAC
jgi:hypothetical protein